MKKVLMTLTLLCSFFALTTVNAATKEEVNLKELKNDSMIIGHRIYDTNYLLSLYDIVSASSEYAAETGEQAPIYVYVVDSSNADNNFMIVYTGPVQEDGTVPTKIIEDVEEVYPGSVIDSTAINNSPLYDYMANIIEQGIADAAKALNGEDNEIANSYGFESIVYDKETKTGTFTIAEPKRSLADYKDSGIVDMFLAIVENADTVTYTIGGEEITVETKDLTQTKVVEIAYALLKDMAGDAEELNYASVANKTANATVKVTYDGFDYEETFTLAFAYNVEEDKDAELEGLAEELNKEAEDYGFSYIKYDKTNKTGTFAIKNLEASLADYKDSGIVDMFLEFIKDSETVTYTIAGKEVTVETKDLTQTNVIEIAYALLKDMAGDAEELNYASVANKTRTAKVVYLIAGEEVEITYTLAFTYNFEETKDVDLGKLAEELNKTAKDYGFASIKYDAKTNTGTFTITDITRSLADYKDSGIVDMFLEFIKDAKTVTYTIAGKEVTVETKDLTQTNVIEIAYALLKDLAGDAEELNYASVANKTASAKVEYEGEVVHTYTLAFAYNLEETNDATLTDLAKELNKEANGYGFESIAYDTKSNTGTFTIANPTISLANYKDSGIVDMFLEFIKGSEKVTYTIAGKEVTVETKDLTQTNVVEIAYALLSDMAGDAEELNYASVANKTASAKVLYLIGGEEVEVTYTLEFVYNLEETNDAMLTELAKELNKTAEDYGFASIEYDTETNKGTFTILDSTRSLADYKDSGIVDMFLGFIAFSKEVTYTIAGNEVTVETKDLTQTNVVEIAYALLSDMAGDAEELNYASVAKKEASAKVLYLIGGEEVEVTYTLFFNIGE